MVPLNDQRFTHPCRKDTLDHMGGLAALRAGQVRLPEELGSAKGQKCYLPAAAVADGFGCEVVTAPRVTSPIFSDNAKAEIHKRSLGIPRRQGAPTWGCKSPTDPTGGTVSRTARVSAARRNPEEAAGKALA